MFVKIFILIYCTFIFSVWNHFSFSNWSSSRNFNYSTFSILIISLLFLKSLIPRYSSFLPSARCLYLQAVCLIHISKRCVWDTWLWRGQFLSCYWFCKSTSVKFKFCLWWYNSVPFVKIYSDRLNYLYSYEPLSLEHVYFIPYIGSNLYKFKDIEPYLMLALSSVSCSLRFSLFSECMSLFLF